MMKEREGKSKYKHLVKISDYKSSSTIQKLTLSDSNFFKRARCFLAMGGILSSAPAPFFLKFFFCISRKAISAFVLSTIAFSRRARRAAWCFPRSSSSWMYCRTTSDVNRVKVSSSTKGDRVRVL